MAECINEGNEGMSIKKKTEIKRIQVWITEEIFVTMNEKKSGKIIGKVREMHE